MKASERVLVIGIDYSDFCIPAVDEAVLFAGGSPGTRLIPLLALPGGPTTSPPEAAAESAELIERSKENLVRLLDMRAHALGAPVPPITPSVRFGSAADCLLEEAKQQGATHIFVGTRGRRGMSHLLLGSVAEEVSQNASCSVLIARARLENPAFVSEPPVTEPQRADEEEEDTQELPRTLWESGSTLDDGNEAAAPPARVLTEPHIEGNRVIVHVLDTATGQAFVVGFDDLETLRVDPLEGAWVPAPSSAARARAARAAREDAQRTPEVFQQLFDQLAAAPRQ